MARFSGKVVDGQLIVTIKGRLVARDLRRLEHLCGPALEQPRAPLTLRLTQASADEEVVRAYLDQLARRGAVIVTGFAMFPRASSSRTSKPAERAMAGGSIRPRTRGRAPTRS